MKLPNKIKTFTWRAYQDGLPAFHNLSKKQVAVEDKRIFCQQSIEDLAHALFF